MRKFNTRKILLIVGAVLFTALFVFSGFMALRQYRDTKQSAEAFNAVADFVKPVPTTLPEDEGNEEDYSFIYKIDSSIQNEIDGILDAIGSALDGDGSISSKLSALKNSS